MHHRIKLSAIVGVIAAIGALGSIWPGVSTASTLGVDWVSRTSAADSSWMSVTYGKGLFVAVANSGTSRVMTSPDGVAWTAHTGQTGSWSSVTYGAGTFVAVATSGEVMHSSDGVTWTLATLPPTNGCSYWTGVAFGNGTFVAITNDSPSGAGAKTCFLTSTDGVSWTNHEVLAGTSAAEQQAIAFGAGVFVSVSRDGTANDVMTSADGITWQIRSTPNPTIRWGSVTYGDGRFVVVGGGTKVITSTDGISWAEENPNTSNSSWNAVAYGRGLFAAVTGSGTGNRVMTSPDGTAWSSRSSAADNNWTSVAYANGLFVAVSNTGTGNRVMTSGTFMRPTLTVTRAGAGSGTVASTPSGIDCGPTCSGTFDEGTAVTLTAAPAAGSTFTGWSDGCSGTATTCTVTISAATTVTATFTKDAATPTAATTPAEKASTPLTIARAKGNASIITTTVKATTPGRAVMTGTVGGKAAFRPGTHVFTKPSTATIRAALNDRVRALLRTRDVRVKITVRFTAADGRTTTSTRTVLLKKIKVRPEPVTG